MNQIRLIITLAMRNVWRSKRRTGLTLLTIMVGCAMIILINAFAKGGHDKMIDDAVLLSTGHIQIHEKGFWDNLTIDYAFVPDPGLIRRIEANPHVSGYAPRIQTGGLIAMEGGTRGVMIQGVDPSKEPSVSRLYRMIASGGRFLKPGDHRHVVIGALLAKNIGATPGDRISIISQGFDGSIAAEKLEVVGILKTGSPMMDRETVLMPLSVADEMFSMMGFIHALVIVVDDPIMAGHVRDDLARGATALEPPLEVLGWETLMPEMVQYIQMDDIGGYIFDFILYLVVAFGVLNTIQMSVYERTREFGIMLSIGTGSRRIFSMVLVETILITVTGIILGAILGVCLSCYFQVNPIDYSEYAEEIAVWGVTTTTYPAEVTPLNVAVTAMITFFSSLFFSVFPAVRASRLNPVKAIRRL